MHIESVEIPDSRLANRFLELCIRDVPYMPVAAACTEVDMLVTLGAIWTWKRVHLILLRRDGREAAEDSTWVKTDVEPLSSRIDSVEE